jgi:Flp pilus assembly protein TadG
MTQSPDGRRRLAQDEQGAVAVLLALSLLPLSLAAVGAVDLTRALSARGQLQDSLDAAALAGARSSPTDAEALQAIGARVLARNLGPTPDLALSGSAQFVVGEKGTVIADAAATVDTVLAQYVLGRPVRVAAHSEVARGDLKLEIAMVLDNTGSMAGGKINSLRVAAANFVDTMAAAAAKRADSADAVKISLVPFSQTVRIDPSYRTASWIDQDGGSPINDEIFNSPAKRLELFDRLGVGWAGCLESRGAPYDVSDTPPRDDGTSAGRATLFTPYFAPDEPDLPGAANNYLVDDIGGSDWLARQGSTTKYVPTAGLNSQSGPNASCTLQPLRRLTSDYRAVKGDIAGMNAIGDTNIPFGLVWGWHTLSPHAPFADGAAYTQVRTKKIAVVMTDGFNQFTAAPNPNGSQYSGSGYVWQGRVKKKDGTKLKGGSAAERTAAMDSRLSLLCENMKAAGVDIYTVGVQVAASHTGVLRACATHPDQYHDVANGSGMNVAFQAIAAQINNLHLSR